MIYNSYQKSIFNAISNNNTNIVITAMAGSGKTSTIVESLNYIGNDKKVLYCAFNKSIEIELNERIDKDNVVVSTLHAFGFSMLKKHIGYVRINKNKYNSYLYKLRRNGVFDNPNVDFTIVKELVELSRHYLSITYHDIKSVSLKYELMASHDDIELTYQILEWGCKNTLEIDYTDMVYLPYALKIKITQYDWVFIDEAQDVSPAQRYLIIQASKNGHFCATGDPNQAIYGFCGADSNSFKLFLNEPNTILLPLPINYRCGKNIIESVHHIVPDIQANDNAIDGIIDVANINDIREGDMVLSRTSSPLVKLCMELLSQGKSVILNGSDIGLNLIDLLQKSNANNINELELKLDNLKNDLIEKFIKRYALTHAQAMATEKYSNLCDQIDALKAIAHNCKTIKDIEDKIKYLFSNSNDNKSIFLSTVHKAKGLESDRVFILYPEDFYNKKAMGTSWGRDQENNLVYVAHTRAKNELYFIKKPVEKHRNSAKKAA